MYNVNQLLDVVSNLHALADSVQTVADAMAENESDNPTQSVTPTPMPENISETKPERVPEKTSEIKSEIEPEPKLKTKPITLEKVRAVLAAKSHDGFTAEVRELLEKHGAKKLSEIDPSESPALLAEAEAMK